MAIDIHALLGKNPVTKSMSRPKFGYKYLVRKNGQTDKPTNRHPENKSK